MHYMCVAGRTILLELDSLRMFSLILGRIIIPVFTGVTGQNNDRSLFIFSHNYPLTL